MPFGGERVENPQLENGYTRVANEILEIMAKTKFSPTQYRIIFVVWRYTYGFQRKSHDLSLTFLSEATGCDLRQLQRELKRLIKMKVLISKEVVGRTREVGFNKKVSQWAIGETTNGEIDNGETTNGAIGETTNDAIGEIDNQERKKESIKEIYDYYLSLNLKKHRAYTEDMAKAIKKAMKNNKYTAEYCKTLLERHEKVVETTKNSPYPVKARSLSEFFGQKVFNGTHLICSEYEEGGKYYEQYIKEVEVPKASNPPPLKLIIRDNY